MGSPRWRKMLGDLRAHRGRTVLAVLAMAVGLAGAGTVLDTWALVRVATRDGFLASDPPAATITVDSLTPGLLARITTVPGVRDVDARRTVVARVEVDGTTYTAMLFVPDGPTMPRIGRPIPETGEWPAPDGAIVIERSSLAFSGAALGGSVTLAGSGPALRARVAGVARDVTLAPGWMEHLVYGFVSRGTVRALGLPDHPNEIRIVTTDRTLDQAGVRRLVAAVRDTIVAAGGAVRDVDVPVPGQHVHAAQMDSLLYTQGAFGLLALLLSGFLVVNLIAAMLAGQVREIGILKTLGGRTSQVATLYLVVAAIVGATAVALAVPAAMLLGRRYAMLKAELLNFDLTGHALPAWVVLLQVAAGLAIPVLAAALPVWRGCRIPVAEALRDVGITDDAQAPAWLHRVRGVHRPLLLSLRNAFRRRQRLLLTLLALSSAGAVFIGAQNLRRAVHGATDLVFAANQYDVSLRLSAPVDADSVTARVRAIAGVADAEAWTGASATIDRGDGLLGDGFSLVAPPVGTRLLRPTSIEGRWLAPIGTDAASAAGSADGPPAKREIVIARALQRLVPGLGVGDTLPLRIAGVAAPWTVVGIIDAGPSPAAYAAREALTPLVGHGARSVVLRAELRGEASQLELIARVRAALAADGITVGSSTRLVESRRVMEDHLLMVVDFLGAMAWLMLVVGGLGLGSTMAIAVLERTRELGVLRAVGARDRTIFTLVMVEALAVGLMSWLLALPLSVPMSLVLGEAFGRIMVPVPPRPVPDGPAVLAWLALVVAVSLVSSAWPARRAVRVPAARALSYE